MNTNAKINDMIEKIKQQEELLQPFRKIISKNHFESFQNIIKTFKADAKAKENENRLLKIGVIGQIKRGKSSFLNALLFDGQDILPKGATPMTAALTKIRYAQKPYAKLEFYSKNDWNNIEEVALNAKAAEENKDFMGELSEEEKACAEIYNNAMSSNILDKLGATETVEGVSKIEDLLNKLENYIGADGIYTPIVKSLELGVNIDSIKDIEIIDTPGTNDPVTSRGSVTRDFIGQCDVVFFLSLSSQFLDKNDMILLTQNIPSKGVQNIYLVGSLFDSAMLDAYGDYEDAGTLIENLKHKYAQRAKEDIEQMMQKSGKADVTTTTLLKSLPPIFISGMCYNIATHLDDKLSEEEQLTLDNLNDMYGDDFEKDDLLYIANINDEVQEKIDAIKEDKESILKNAFENVVQGVEKQLAILHKDIKMEIQNNYNLLKDNDVAALEQKQLTIQKAITSGTIKIDNIFTSYMIDIEKKFAILKQELKNEVTNAGHVMVEMGSETERYSVVTGEVRNFFNDDWGRESRERTIYYKYANVYNTMEQLENFARDSELNIAKTVENIIDIKSFRKEIMKNVMGLFDVEDDNFDPSDIVDTLKNAVDRISIPEINMDTSKYVETIRDNFSSSEVKDNEIDSLKKETKRVLSLIMNDIQNEIIQQTKKIIQSLNNAKENFIPKLLQDSSDKLIKMKDERDNLEESVKQYEELLKLL